MINVRRPKKTSMVSFSEHPILLETFTKILEICHGLPGSGLEADWNLDHLFRAMTPQALLTQS